MSEVVGRGPAVAAISHWFESDGTAILVVEGEAGLGKTTVWAASVAAIRDGGATVLESIPTEAESGLSYSGLADLLGDVLPELRDALPRPQGRALAVAVRLEDAGDRPADETAVARGLPEALRVLASRRGRVLVAIDDLRWLDAPSLAAVVYAARRLRPDHGVRILTTHRLGATEPAALADPAVATRLRLAPLSVGGIHRIVRTQAGITLSRPRLLEVHAASLGNPLHALELARALESGVAIEAGGSLAGLFRTRIHRLPDATRAALVLVAASADRAVDRLSRAWSGDLYATLTPAIDAGLVEVVDGRVQPSHPLVTHVAYDGASDAERRAAHRRLADSAMNDEERAIHVGRATDGPDPAAAALVEAAAREARARGVRGLSATLFESAALLTPDGAIEDRTQRLLGAATAWFDAGDTQRVVAILEPLVAVLPPNAQRAEARWRLGIALDESGRWPEATALWRAALEDSADPGLGSQVRCSLAITAMYTESVERAADWASTAVAEAEASGSASWLARSLAVQGFLLAMGGRPGYETSIERALELESTVEEPLGEWSPSAMAAEVARQTGDIPAAIRHYAAVLDAATNRGDANVEQWAAFGLGQAEVLAGGFRRASELADVVLDIADQTDVMTIPARSLRAHVDAWLGELASARALVREAIDRSRAADELAHLFGALMVLGAVESCSGRPAEAAEAYVEARHIGAELGFAHATARRVDLLAVEAAATAGDLGRAEEALAGFDAAVAGAAPAWSVPLRQRAHAALLAARGDLGAAVGELEAALEGNQLPVDEARALLALGTALRRLREHRRSRAMTERALERFLELATPPWADAARRELARLPGRRTQPDGELTNAEARIAELVAAGRSNREVAAELVLSVKTIEVTLTRVYEKVGVRSRSELAARMAHGGD